MTSIAVLAAMPENWRRLPESEICTLFNHAQWRSKKAFEAMLENRKPSGARGGQRSWHRASISISTRSLLPEDESPESGEAGDQG